MNFLLSLPWWVPAAAPFVLTTIAFVAVVVHEDRVARASGDDVAEFRERRVAQSLRPLGCGVQPLPVGRRLRSGPGSVESEIRSATAETPQDSFLPFSPGS